jgi:hypothetical protein
MGRSDIESVPHWWVQVLTRPQRAHPDGIATAGDLCARCGSAVPVEATVDQLEARACSPECLQDWLEERAYENQLRRVTEAALDQGVFDHPDGRAAPGTNCRWCRQTISSRTHWRHRDRHVCSAGCNEAMIRSYGEQKLIDATTGTEADDVRTALQGPPTPSPDPAEHPARSGAALSRIRARLARGLPLELAQHELVHWLYQAADPARSSGLPGARPSCEVCSQPIPGTAPLDTLVCSARCHHADVRAFLAAELAGRTPLGSDDAPDGDRGDPLVFGTDLTRVFPYDYLGTGPRPGDTVDRHGSTTIYQPANHPPELLDRVVACVADHPDTEHTRYLLDAALNAVDAVHVQTGVTARIWGVGARIWHRDGTPLAPSEPFTADGGTWVWHHELIRDVDENDVDTPTWRAWVCLPHPTPDRWEPTLWSPRFQARSEQRRRITESTARHARRLRKMGPDGTLERIDPRQIYERDGWICQLCKDPIGPELAWPHLQSASLDHIVALAANGSHTEANVQASHLICNIRKGARG